MANATHYREPGRFTRRLGAARACLEPRTTWLTLTATSSIIANGWMWVSWQGACRSVSADGERELEKFGD